MKRVEKQKLQRLVRQSLRSLCEAGLPDSTNINIEGLIGITVNSEYVVLVNIQEEIGEGYVDDIECPSHEETGHSERHVRSKGLFHPMGHSLNPKVRHHLMRRHVMQNIIPQMNDASPGSPRGRNHTLSNQSQAAQLQKKTSPKHKQKQAYDFETYEVEDDKPESSPAFTVSSSPSKSITVPNTEGKANYSFQIYDREHFQEPTSSQPDAHETMSNESPSKATLGSKTLATEDVQASTICITPVVDSPKTDEITQTNEQTPSAMVDMQNQLNSISDFGRKIGTLTAVKQEGASLKRAAKTHSVDQSATIEEISDSDNTMHGDEKPNSEKDKLVSSNSETMKTGEETQAINKDSPSKLPVEENKDDQNPMQVEDASMAMDIDALSPMDEHQHELVDLDHSLLQILPEVVDKNSDQDIIHEIVEIDDCGVKGEPKEYKDQIKSRDYFTEEEERPDNKKEALRKKIGKKAQLEVDLDTDIMKGMFDDSDTIPEDYEDADGFMLPGPAFPPPPPAPFLGRGLGRFCVRRGGMFGRGFFPRGGGVLPFHGHPCHRMGEGERKPMRCRICGSCFMNKANYETHMMKHENKGQGSAGLGDSIGYSCPYCKKRFRYKSWLEQHITTHTKEKLFRCPYCSKAYTRRRNVHKHIEMFHPEIMTGQQGQVMEEPLGIQETINLDT